MKPLLLATFTLATAFFSMLSASTDTESSFKLSAEESYRIVAAEELAREKAADEREAKLLSADIVETAVADIGSKKVIFNLVSGTPDHKQLQEYLAAKKAAEQKLPVGTKWERPANYKESISFGLSGVVYDDSITELWWNHGETHTRVFINANFLYFEGIGEFEDAKHKYSVFSLITAAQAESARTAGKWVPSLADFTSGTLEYLIVESGGDTEFDDARFDVIDAMVTYYSEHCETMKLAFDNRRIKYEARREYLRQHPPKQRDEVINYRLFDPKSYRAYQR